VSVAMKASIFSFDGWEAPRVGDTMSRDSGNSRAKVFTNERVVLSDVLNLGSLFKRIWIAQS